ncbi:hypothetical protein BJ322DRAFT_1114188 [Thelephora terrestris]|uniref:Uncharacterized protein n=1 Tax=Thelephora terrestris TaxID=56493 RepID=A0A9P6H3H3_9AGAM|nr:hypothetical protein BJ322DRAFT_1114188 [Thelephora terrestris]
MPMCSEPFEDAIPTTSQAPQVTNYPPESRVLAEIGQQIRSRWLCSLHGTCYISSESEHVVLHRHRLKQWATRILASRGTLTTKDSPPLDLLAEWGVDTASVVETTSAVATPTTSKPRGRNGPHPAIPIPALIPVPSPSPSSATESMLTLMVASNTMMMNHMVQNGLNSGLGNQLSPGLKRPLSPLPDVCGELKLFMNSFGEFYRLSNGVVEAAFTALQDKGYSTFVLGDKDLDIKRIGELTGLSEGVVLGLRQFAGDWVERKQAKRGRYN